MGVVAQSLLEYVGLGGVTSAVDAAFYSWSAWFTEWRWVVLSVAALTAVFLLARRLARSGL